MFVPRVAADLWCGTENNFVAPNFWIVFVSTEKNFTVFGSHFAFCTRPGTILTVRHKHRCCKTSKKEKRIQSVLLKEKWWQMLETTALFEMHVNAAVSDESVDVLMLYLQVSLMWLQQRKQPLWTWIACRLFVVTVVSVKLNQLSLLFFPPSLSRFKDYYYLIFYSIHTSLYWVLFFFPLEVALPSFQWQYELRMIHSFYPKRKQKSNLPTTKKITFLRVSTCIRQLHAHPSISVFVTKLHATTSIVFGNKGLSESFGLGKGHCSTPLFPVHYKSRSLSVFLWCRVLTVEWDAFTWSKLC